MNTPIFTQKYCIIPTTHNAYINLLSIYSISGNELDFIFLSPFLFKKSECSFYKWSDIAKKVWGSNKLVRLFSLYFFMNSLKYSIREYLLIKKFDYIVVSNDCGLIQGLFVEEANKLSIPTITHQVASATIGGDVSRWKKLKRFIKCKVFGFPVNNGYGASSREVILMGRGWAHDLKINKYHVFCPQNLVVDVINKDVTLTTYLSSHKKWVFIGQPLVEIGLFSEFDVDVFYESLRELNSLLWTLYEVDLIYKPHPQEQYYQKHKSWLKVISDTPEKVLSDFDVFISVMSTMNLQAKKLGKISLQFKPEGTNSKYIRQSLCYFDGELLLDKENLSFDKYQLLTSDYFTKSEEEINEIYKKF